MTKIEKLDKKSQIEKRYQEKMFILEQAAVCVDDIYKNKQHLAIFKCENCKYSEYDSDGLHCKRNNFIITVDKWEKCWNCRWLNYNYSDLYKSYRDYGFSMDAAIHHFDLVYYIGYRY